MISDFTQCVETGLVNEKCLKNVTTHETPLIFPIKYSVFPDPQKLISVVFTMIDRRIISYLRMQRKCSEGEMKKNERPQS